MNERIFYRVFFLLLTVMLVLTLAHAAYLLYAYRHASIIYFIGKELW